MSQNDYVIGNQTAPNFRADLNDALQALASLSSGSTAPSTTYANMLWYDTGNNILKMRTEADDAWIDIGTLNQSTNEFEVANLTELTQTQVEDDTDTTFGLVSGQRLGQAMAANATSVTLGSVGSYALLGEETGVTRAPGVTLAGSSLRYANVGNTLTAASVGLANTAPSGTWMLMGNHGYYYDGIYSTINNRSYAASLWLRIS